MQTKYVVHSVYEIHQFDLAKPTHIENSYEGGKDISYMQWSVRIRSCVRVL